MKNIHYYLLGGISYIGFIQLVQIFAYLTEILIYKLFQSVEFTYLSSVFIYLTTLVFISFFLIKKTKRSENIFTKHSTFIIVIFIIVYIVAEIMEKIHSNIIISGLINDFPKEKADYILFSDAFFNLFNILLIIIMLIFTFKTRKTE